MNGGYEKNGCCSSFNSPQDFTKVLCSSPELDVQHLQSITPPDGLARRNKNLQRRCTGLPAYRATTGRHPPTPWRAQPTSHAMGPPQDAALIAWQRPSHRRPRP